MIGRLVRIALLCALPVLVRGAVPLDQNTARGFAGKVYQLGELDSVNVFNGNLTVRLPIGQSYSVGPALSYQFMLSNNSKTWDYEFYEYDMLDGKGRHKRRAIPETYSNAGLGWTFSLGKLLPPRFGTYVTDYHGWIYVSADGAHREFFPALRSQDPALPVDPTVFYTTDGSYLRLRLEAGANTHWVEFPDGRIHEFHADGRLKKIRDRFENWIAVSYGSVPCGELSCDRWTITDGHGATASSRVHTVTFANKAGKYSGDNFGQVVSQVDLAAFGDATATYRFHYADDASPAGTTIGRGGCGDWIDTDPAQVGAPLLAAVSFPDDSQYQMEYLYADTTGCSSGGLKKLTLPTGGSYAWEYGPYVMTLQECSADHFWTSSYGGVTKRSAYQPGATTPHAVWTYRAELGPPVQPGTYNQTCHGTIETMPYPPEEVTATLVGPTGDKTVHYFSAYPTRALAPNSNFKGHEHGLPFTRNDELETGGRALSSAEYDCSQPGCADGGTLQRKTYVEYEGDGFRPGGSLLNSRVERQTVIHVTDSGCGSGGCRVDTTHSDFDGFGHYRQSAHSSNFPSSAARTTFTNFNPGSSASGRNSDGSAYLAPGDEWILGMYDHAWVSEGTRSRKTISAFDPGTGALQSVRTLAATSGSAASLQPGSSDLLVASCRQGVAGSRGFITSERHLGGDLAPIPAGDPCTAGRGAGHYFIDHAYTFTGADVTRHTAQYAGTQHFIADEDLDANTGRASITRDPAGIATAFRYDPSGRLLAVMPTGQASTTYSYDVTANPPALIARNCTAGADSCTTGALAEMRFYFDGFGRLAQERHRMPAAQNGAAQWAASWTTHDALGRPQTRTIPVTVPAGAAGASTTTAGTSWTYDFAGRVLRETRPDQSFSTFVYDGVRSIAKSVAEAQGTPVLRTTERYDGLGRLVSVIQPSGPTSASAPTGAPVATNYGYDFADRLVSVAIHGPESTTPQARTFQYDGRGFLLEETHPESGTTQYRDYDARGHAGRRHPAGGHSIFKHRYTFDAAERLVRVDTGTPGWYPGATHVPEFRAQKELLYAAANDGNNKKKGKLETAIRLNYAACQDLSCFGDAIKVTEQYRYDLLGRTSGRTTVIDDVTHGSPLLIKSIDQIFTYNELGLPATASYPTCDDCGVPSGATPRRDISLGYEAGMLQSIGGYVSRLTYAPSGIPTAVVHSNGITDATTLDASGRIQSIGFSEWASCGTPPAIAVQPQETTAQSGTAALLEVTASGTNLQYQWYEAAYFSGGTYHPAAPIPGATARQYTTAALTADKSFFVQVSNACKMVQSQTVAVTVVACSNPSITAQPQSGQIASGSATTLSVSASGASLHYQWYRGAAGNSSQPVGTDSSSYTTPQLSATTQYWVRVTNDCGSVASATATVTIALGTPTGLDARMLTSTSVRLTWTGVTGAASYEVWRRSGGSFQLAANNAASPWTDSGRESGRAYVYQVRAVDAEGGSLSAFSAPDLATLTTFTVIAANITIVDDSHWHELLGALNAVRAANGDAALTWAGILPAGVPAPATGVTIRAAHLDALRQRFTSALQALGMPAPPYTNPNLATEPKVRAVHVTELQQRAQ